LVLFPAVTFIVLFPDPVTDDGLKLALAWFGSPLTLKLTVPLKPLIGDTPTV
jgi:hypothetical protein